MYGQFAHHLDRGRGWVGMHGPVSARGGPPEDPRTATSWRRLTKPPGLLAGEERPRRRRETSAGCRPRGPGCRGRGLGPVLYSLPTAPRPRSAGLRMGSVFRDPSLSVAILKPRGAMIGPLTVDIEGPRSIGKGGLGQPCRPGLWPRSSGACPRGRPRAETMERLTQTRPHFDGEVMCQGMGRPASFKEKKEKRTRGRWDEGGTDVPVLIGFHLNSRTVRVSTRPAVWLTRQGFGGTVRNGRVGDPARGDGTRGPCRPRSVS